MRIIKLISCRSDKGITLIEIVLAVTVISILAAVIVPRALRANVEAKYVGVRQAAAEIGRWGMDWATRNLESQPYSATCNLNDYVATLAGYVGDINGTNWTKPEGAANVNIDLTGICRPANEGITFTVSDMIPPESHPRNPFNGLSYFNTSGANDGNTFHAGLLFLDFFAEQEGGDTFNNYYFVYTGTDSETTSEWHAGMSQGGAAGLKTGSS